MLANATYSLLTNIPTVLPLVDGAAQLPTDHGLLQVSLVGPWVEGAINQDGARDAAIILLEKVEETTGRFYSLRVLLNTNGELVEAAALLLGDRIWVNTLQIQPDGAIVVDLFIQGPNDPLAAATLHVIQTYRSQNGQLRLLSQIPVGDNGGTPGRTVCPNTYPTRLQKGGRAYVIPTPPQPNRIRNSPSKSATLIGSIQPGEKMSILDWPRCADGWIWWYIQADGGVVGWTSEGDANGYWLAPEGSAPPVLNFSGAWQTNFAQMTLTQANNQVSGSYTRYGRQVPTVLTGVVTGQTLTGANEINTRFSFTLRADGQSFDGYWIGRDGQARQWCGVRSGPLPAGCGFSGSWQATIGGNPGVMQLTQTVATVVGTYNASGQPGQLTGNIGGERPGIASTEKMYSAYGQYQGGAYGGSFRFDLLNNESKQLQGCYLDNSNGNFGDWCGWRDGVAHPAQCLPVVACP